MNINEFKYYVPLEHPRQSHLNIKNNSWILKINGGKLGIMGFNNMIPIKSSELITFAFSDLDDNMCKLYTKQFIFCNRNRSLIYSKALNTYNSVIGSSGKYINSICCDFLLLEKKCAEYK